uniref:Uncharacterized protein n=1 Tax=Plectus sambesii TaxID=2011161 RepID=A0A914XKN6_9BILA
MLDYSSSSQESSLLLVAAIVGAFCLGIIFSVGIACYAVRRNSNCCYAFGKKSQTQSTTTTRVQPPLKANIYTPPPIRNSYHPTNGHMPMHRMSTANSDLGIEGKTYAHYELADFDDSLWDRDSALTLTRTMRASLNNRDYL